MDIEEKMENQELGADLAIFGTKIVVLDPKKKIRLEIIKKNSVERPAF